MHMSTCSVVIASVLVSMASKADIRRSRHFGLPTVVETQSMPSPPWGFLLCARCNHCDGGGIQNNGFLAQLWLFSC